MEKFVTIEIDGARVTVPAGSTIMQAADTIGIHIPRLCYHSKLSEFGACRICIVEVEGMKNYPTSCTTVVTDGMVIKTHAEGVRSARKEILKLILANNHQDCTICAKNGDCQLQALAKEMGIKDFKFEGEMKNYPKDDSSPSIIRDAEKCILCGKCVRVCSEIQGVSALTFAQRGFMTNVTPAFNTGMSDSVCVNCGQCVNVCPTGALIEHDATNEVWDNLADPEKIVIAQIAPAVRVAIGEGFDNEPGTDMTYQSVTALRMLGFDVVFDTQFSADLTIMEEAYEFIEHVKKGGTQLPLITSCSPGWIKFCEAFYPEFLKNISTCKSPQQMMGAMIKTYYSKVSGFDPSRVYNVSIMPCTAKKFEAGRPEMSSSGYRDVDAVLTTRELIKMIKEAGIVFNDLKPGEFNSPMGQSTGAAPIFGATGGVMEAALRTAYEVLTGKVLKNLNFTQVRGLEGIKEAVIPVNGIDVRACVVNGLANVHRVFADIKNKKKYYHFIEIMACPGGCIGGGGQPYAPLKEEAFNKVIYKKRAEALYDIDMHKTLRSSHKNPDIIKIYDNFLGKPLGKLSHKLLHTHYVRRYPSGIYGNIKDEVKLFN